jgi:hypothetical protein
LEKRKELEKKKTDLENEKDDLEASYKTTKSEATKVRIDKISEELKKFENDLENHPEYKALYEKVIEKEDSLSNL